MMKYILTIAALLIFHLGYGQGIYTKLATNNIWNRIKADSVLITPRDTTPTNNALFNGSPVGDYGRIAAKDTLYYFHNGQRFKRVAFFEDITAGSFVTVPQLTDSLNTRGSLYEKLVNKATTLAGANNTTYPTTLAVSNAIAALPVPTLQQVTTAGNTTSNTVVIGNHTLGTSRILVNSAIDDGSSALQAKGKLRLNSAANNNLLLEDNASGFGVNVIESLPLTFSTDNSERVRITAAGNVGIGVTNPLVKLTLPNNQYIGWQNAANSGVDAGIRSNSTDGIDINTSGSTRFTVLANGNVGIATTSPSYSFQNDAHSHLNSVSVNTYVSSTIPFTVRASVAAGNSTAYVSNINDVAGTYGLFIDHKNVDNASKGLTVANDGVEQMVFTGAGRLGVGTNSPVSAADVVGTLSADNLYSHNTNDLQLWGQNGTVRIFSGTGAAASQMTFNTNGKLGIGMVPSGTAFGAANPVIQAAGNVGATDAFILEGGGVLSEFGLGTNLAFLRTVSNHPLQFLTNDIERARISAAGDFTITNKMGVAQSTPTSTLHVTGSVAFGLDPVVHTSNFTVGNYYMVMVNNGSASVAVTLPSAASFPERIIEIAVTSNANPVTVDGNNVNFSWAPSPRGPVCKVVSNGSNWFFISGF